MKQTMQPVPDNSEDMDRKNGWANSLNALMISKLDENHSKLIHDIILDISSSKRIQYKFRARLNQTVNKS